eukprot:m.1043934 g.1043934  ORF g.1043934 m.1043934 type:complete len:104 (-) comp24168_c0_seq34:3086-3397(-)
MCVADFCQHGGTCDLTSVDTATIQVECSCTEGYSGPQCENNKSNYGIIAFVVVALFVLIFFYWRHRRNRKLFHVFISYRVRQLFWPPSFVNSYVVRVLCSLPM